MSDAKNELTWKKLRVGTIVTLALLLVLAAIFFAGNIESLLAPRLEIFAQIRDVRGLRSGSPVWFSGVEIGAVKEVSLDPVTGTIVKLSIKNEAAAYIPLDSTAVVTTMGLLGDKYVEIMQGSRTVRRLVAGDTIRGRSQAETLDIVQSASGTIGQVSEFADKLNVFMEGVNKNEGTLAGFLKDPAVFQNLKSSTASLAAILKEIETGNGTVSKLIKNPSLYDQLEKSSVQLSAILTQMDAGKGPAGKMLRDEEMAVQLKDSVKGLSETVVELKAMVKEMKANPKKYFKITLF
ncbi:MAG: MCE family protein [Spirochaetia bacterium]|nr:MCE family protein [Spirochaetia bacterium]